MTAISNNLSPAQERMNKRFLEIDNCKTLQELSENLWRPAMDEVRASNVDRRRFFCEWVENYKNGTKCPNWNHKNPKALTEDIYKPDWDEADGLFQGLRIHIQKWIENYCMN